MSVKPFVFYHLFIFIRETKVQVKVGIIRGLIELTPHMATRNAIKPHTRTAEA